MAWPQHTTHLATVDSTNSYARRELEACGKQFPLPWLIVADEQTAGRGRNNKAWYSDMDSLTFTLVWQADNQSEQANKLGLLPLLIGLACASAIENLVSAKVQVKWPNDIFIDGQKVGGILIESRAALGSNAAPIFMIGIGINCDTKLERAGGSFVHPATNLRKYETSVSLYLKAKVLNLLMEQMQETLSQSEQFGQIVEALWPAKCFLTGRWIAIQVNERIIEGECLGIDPQGALLVRTIGGSWESIIAGQVIRF